MTGSLDGADPEVESARGAPDLRLATAARLENDVDHLLRVVGDLDEVEIVGRDHALAQQLRLDPVEEAGVELAADEDHREVPDLAGLDEGERLHHLVERAEA